MAPDHRMRLFIHLTPCPCDSLQALRILIVYDDSYHDENFQPVITDHTESETSYARQSLEAIARLKDDLKDTNAGVLVFRISIQPLGTTPGNLLLSLQNWTNTSGDGQLHERVAYDRRISLEPGRRKVCLWLRFSRVTGYFGCISHRVLISPIRDAKARKHIDLPQEILRRSVGYSITPQGDTGQTWEQRLLSYALIQKSWLHLLELFWDLAFGGSVRSAAFPIHALRGVVSSLRYHIPLAQSKIQNFSVHVINKEFPDYADAMKKILEVARRVQRVEIDFETFMSATSELASLETVETFAVDLVPLADDPPYQVHSLTSLQNVMREWKLLRILTIHGPIGVEDDISTLNFTAPYVLEQFDLVDAQCSGNHLPHFFSNPLPQRLHSLWLTRVKGLSNIGLAQVFSLIAHTIEEIRIENCNIERLHPSEAYALDEAFPRMKVIKSVHADSTFASVLSISEGVPSQATETRLFLRVYNTTDFFSPSFMLLQEAIRKTNLKGLTLFFDQGYPSRQYRGIIQRAEEIAASRHLQMTLRYRIRPRY